MEITRCRPDDVEAVLELYRHATDLQQMKGATPWPSFDRAMVGTEIDKGMQWKIVVAGRPRCVWSVTDTDPLIWGKRNADPALYIHRIATDPGFRGRGFVTQIVAWAKAFAFTGARRFVRMDTVGDNAGLIRHYTRCGFTFLGLSKLADTTGLPAHYHEATVSLFEIDLGC